VNVPVKRKKGEGGGVGVLLSFHSFSTGMKKRAGGASGSERREKREERTKPNALSHCFCRVTTAGRGRKNKKSRQKDSREEKGVGGCANIFHHFLKGGGRKKALTLLGPAQEEGEEKKKKKKGGRKRERFAISTGCLVLINRNAVEEQREA